MFYTKVRKKPFRKKHNFILVPLCVFVHSMFQSTVIVHNKVLNMSYLIKLYVHIPFLLHIRFVPLKLADSYNVQRDRFLSNSSVILTSELYVPFNLLVSLNVTFRFTETKHTQFCLILLHF